MPTIEISSDQLVYLDELGAELAEDDADTSDAITRRDAIQFLIDQYEASGGADDAPAPQTEEKPGNDGEDEDDPNDSGRLEAMMELLETHDDKWEQTDSAEGRYAVTLPNGDVDHVRTQDDVRTLLFKHYD